VPSRSIAFVGAASVAAYGGGFFDCWLVPISAAIVAAVGLALGASSSS